MKNGANNYDDVGGELHRLMKQLHEEIGAAGRKGDTSTILRLTERLRRVDTLGRQYEKIQRETQALGYTDSSNVHPVAVDARRTRFAPSDSSAQMESRKARASRIRSSWLAEHGSTLTHVRGTIYQNNKGERLGITYSSRKKMSDGWKWWLGLPGGEFQSAVLLCEHDDDSIKAVCLPSDFIDTHRNLLSKSSGGQDEFNIFERAGKWYLGRQDIGKYVDNCSVVL
jgi:hypothetical protein